MPIRRWLLCLLALTIPVWSAGCSDDDDSTEYVQVDTKRITGFYVGQSEGGHLSVVVDRYAEKAPARKAPLHPAASPPDGVHATLTPDDGSAAIQLTGNETSGSLHFTGSGYDFTMATNNYAAPLSGSYTGPNGNGYVRAYAGTPDSVRVYLGAFTGFFVAGRWHFAAKDSSLIGVAVDSVTAALLTFEGDFADEFDVAGVFGPTSQSWFGHGTLDQNGDASGTYVLDASHYGDWVAAWYLPAAPAGQANLSHLSP
jgi:hypothetical protein